VTIKTMMMTVIKIIQHQMIRQMVVTIQILAMALKKMTQ
jgi:hypothetical protein